MSGWKDWAVGEVVEESDFQTFVQDQVVQVYDNSGARGSALGTAVAEGMVSYLKDTNATEVFTGASWTPIGEGDITAVTAGTALTGGGTSGDVTLNVNQDALFTDGTEGFTMVSGGTAGVTYQPISPNYIINGAFDIWQRGTSITPPSTANTYTADRWAAFRLTGATITQQSFTPAEINANGFGDANFYIRIASAGATTQQGLFQRIEDVRTLAGQTVTVSFWAKSAVAEEYRARFAQNLGVGGSAQVNGVAEVINATTSWQRFSFTRTLDSLSGLTIGTNSYLEFDIRSASDSAYTLDLWGVQVEAGSVATPFRRNANSIQGELAACQRYYQQYSTNTGARFTNGMCQSTTGFVANAILPVRMRTAPTGTFSAANTFAVSNATGARTNLTAISLAAAIESTITISGTVASGLVAGNATELYNAAGQTWSIGLSAEL